MDPKAIGILTLLLVCCSFSVGTMFMMGDDGAPDCDVAKTDWINDKMQSEGFSQSQGESLQNCKVPANLQSRIEDITYCDVAKTDWINGSISSDEKRFTFEQASSLQNCVVPSNLRSRITNKSCSVAQTDWIKSKMENDDWTQGQGEAAQNCFVPNVRQGRIDN
jgi:hypothetical protein